MPGQTWKLCGMFRRMPDRIKKKTNWNVKLFFKNIWHDPECCKAFFPAWRNEMNFVFDC